MLTAYTPYLIGTDPSHAAKSMVNQLTNTAKNRELTNIALSFGGDNTLAIADISARLQALGVGVAAGTAMLANNSFKENSGAWYDEILNWMNS